VSPPSSLTFTDTNNLHYIDWELRSHRKEPLPMFCNRQDLITESDVEQKLIMPMLTAKFTLGLGYSPVDIKTKHDLRRFAIDKGKAEKLYHPDYLIVICGIPIYVIEVKRPDEDPIAAIREARLYANEVNSYFPTGINPCCRIVTSNGLITVTCPPDTNDPDCVLLFEDLNGTSKAYADFCLLLSRNSAQAYADNIRKALTSRPLYKAVNLVGGQSVRDEDVGYNSFGSKLALDYRTVFKPDTRKDRAYIVRNAYIKSQRREHYVDEIDRIIRTAVVSTVPGAKLMEDTSAPREILEALKAGAKLENEIMLLVGSRGCGKTTFVDYVREVKLPRELRDSTVWIHLNLNEAPKESKLLEQWMLQEAISQLTKEHPSIDWDTLDTLQKVFAVEIRRLKKGTLSLLNQESEAYRVRLADSLQSWQSNPLDHLKALSRYLCGERQRLLVVVFDNCDKRDKDDQLHVFEVARWFQSQIRCLIVLPIRDVTYESFKNSPPLDTAIKDLVFRIEPPSFSAVLSARIKLVLNDLATRSQARILDYLLPNGMRVVYPATELGYYLATIFRSLYEHDRLIRSLLLGLSGRDLRKAMEIFLEFCRSGHIGPHEYLKINTSQGKWGLPYHVVARVLLRRSKRFYNGDESFVMNLFQCDPVDVKPDSFSRVALLQWLDAMYGERGPSGIKGFYRATVLIGELMSIGHDSQRLQTELGYLIKHGCVVAEHQRDTLMSLDDLVRISPSGIVHLKLLNDPSYLAACSEDTWVTSQTLAKSVADRIARFGPKVHFMQTTMFANAMDFVEYLTSRVKDEVARPDSFLENVPADTAKLIETVRGALNQKYSRLDEKYGWTDFEKRFSVGTELTGKIQEIKTFGAFIELDVGHVGLLHVSDYPTSDFPESAKVGARVLVRIQGVQRESRKLSLAFVKYWTDS